MIIDFGNMQEEIRRNARGGDGEFIVKMFADAGNRILWGRLAPGSSIGLHTHEADSETIYVVQGSGRMLYDGEYEDLSAGMCHYCPMGHAHSLMNSGEQDLVFFAVIPTH